MSNEETEQYNEAINKLDEAVKLLDSLLFYQCNTQGINEVTIKTEHGSIIFKQD
ncbi:MAG: hypothetical protein KZQ83_00560 [gamma proteobacterium symbiont of Taylorina sp.]|nr:hypothetical protein [gamma proteobacterium symbiont of Taylorina sp.]